MRQRRAGCLAALAGLVVVSMACGKSATAPSVAFSVTGVRPSSAPAGIEVRLHGSGFQPGATVTFGGIASQAAVASASQIVAVTPDHPAGSVEVVVTNPGGASASLARGFTFIPFEIDSVQPEAGFPGLRFFAYGRGFMAGARLSVGGVDAGVGTNPDVIAGIVPPHGLGPADVSIANPGGRSVTLTGGFTYYPSPVIVVTPTVIAPGGSLHVSFDVSLTSGLDWIGLYRLGTDNSRYLAYQYLVGLKGTVTFAAPSQAGQYEFRYLPLDGYDDFARTEVVTVTSGEAAAMKTLAGAFFGGLHQFSISFRKSQAPGR